MIKGRSVVLKWVAEDHVDHFENVLSPALLDAIHLDQVSKAVSLGDVRVGNLHFARVVERHKGEVSISGLWPILELPLHLDGLVFDDFLVLSLDGPIEHLKLAAGAWL